MRLKKSLCLAILLAGCSFQRAKVIDDSISESQQSMVTGSISYESVRKAVLGPRCVSCHSSAGGNAGGANFESYEAVKGWLKRIEIRALVERTMPRGNPLAESEARALGAWISGGAPRNPGESTPKDQQRKERPETSPTAPPSPLPIEASWSSLRSRVLEPKCMECHSQPQPVAGFDASDLQMVRVNAGKIFDRVVLKKDMPPEAPLKKDEEEALTRWILDGMAE